MDRQPLLHDRLVALAAPTQSWSGPDGQIRRDGGVDGVFHADVRVLAEAVLTADGAEPEPIASSPEGPGVVRVSGLLRGLVDAGADPTVRVDRERSVTPGELVETITLSTGAEHPVTTTLALRLSADLASMDEVKAGARALPLIALRLDGDRLRWGDDDLDVTLTAPGAQITVDDDGAEVRWSVTVADGAPREVGVRLVAGDRAAPVVAAASHPWSRPALDGGDDRLRALLAQSLDDLGGLAMSGARTPGETFLAAGAPWFFTLFGRDSIWAARMMLPLGTDLAGGTLRTLAAMQGEQHDPETAEQPGKILHEVRRAAIHFNDAAEGEFALPPVYFGTIDATPLWVCLLHDAWRWGMPADQVEALLPHAERALAWMAEAGDADGDGFLEYIDLSGRGLANQGWKDSGDSVRWRDGGLAQGTIALCEVQAYAHEAAIGGAALLEAFGRPGAQRWRDWAAALRQRFRDQFWVSDDQGRYPAIALDGDKRAVDSLTSNIGHLLGTGLLDADEERLVADRLLSDRLASGFGLRTLATGTGGYWPLRYHGGAVWPHDTAIAITGLARAGFAEHAHALSEQLLRAAPAFGFRLPELFSGDSAEEASRPAPYPASCRPQAWTAAAAVSLLVTELGLIVDVPSGAISAHPAATAPARVEGLRLGSHPLVVEIADGVASLRTDAPVVTGG